MIFLTLLFFACFPVLLLFILKPHHKEISCVVFDMKNRNNSKPIGKQFDSLDQIIIDNNLQIDFSGYFSHEE